MTEPRWRSLYDPDVPGDVEAEPGGMVGMFARRVAQSPDAPQLHYFGTTLTRADVDRRSAALAGGFSRLGVQAGDRVAIALQNTPVQVLSVLAAWRLGAVVVPVNPMYRERELAHLLTDSGARVLIAHPAMRPVIDGLETRPEHVLYSFERDLAGDESGPWPDPPADVGGTVLELMREDGAIPSLLSEADPGDPALLSYTSGTTGPSKGAVNTHGNLAFEATMCRTWLGLSETDAVLTIAPLFHITGMTMHLALGLGCGLPLVLTYRFDPKTTMALVERYRPTFTIGSITAFIAMLNEPGAGRYDLSSLTKVLSGGAPVPSATVERFEQQFGIYLHNAYGLTETTSMTTAVPLSRRAPVDSASGALSVGVPVPGTIIEIRDEHGKELPAGQIGELAITGPQVATAYWRNPEQTASTFPEGTLLTGDVGFMDEEGWVYLVDRKKDLIVASGYKIWPREVEDVLYEHPAVREAAVVGAEDSYRGETVQAFVSLRAGMTVTEAELRTFCRERLAAYKCPSEVIVLDELPKSVSGKILRRELRDQRG